STHCYSKHIPSPDIYTLSLHDALPILQVKTKLNDIEPLNCYAGKINQVFINLIANAIHAIKAKDQQEEETITIITQDLKGYISIDRKSTRLNSSHDQISYAVFCLKKKK